MVTPYYENIWIENMKTERVLEFFERLADIALLSIIWTISSILVISVGAATAAGYNTAIEVLRKKQHRVFPKFWKDFKAVFLQTLPFSFALLVLVLIFHLQMYLPKVNNIDNLYSFVLISQLVVASFLITFFSYSYSLIGRFPLSNSQVISSAFKLCFCSLYRNIILEIGRAHV